MAAAWNDNPGWMPLPRKIQLAIPLESVLVDEWLVMVPISGVTLHVTGTPAAGFPKASVTCITMG
jgi:hypothetical protein